MESQSRLSKIGLDKACTIIYRQVIYFQTVTMESVVQDYYACMSHFGLIHTSVLPTGTF